MGEFAVLLGAALRSVFAEDAVSVDDVEVRYLRRETHVRDALIEAGVMEMPTVPDHAHQVLHRE